MHSFMTIRKSEQAETPSIFFKPMGLSKKYQTLVGKHKLDDGASTHPFLKYPANGPPFLMRKNTSLVILEHQNQWKKQIRQQKMQNQYQKVSNKNLSCVVEGTRRCIKNYKIYDLIDKQQHQKMIQSGNGSIISPLLSQYKGSSIRGSVDSHRLIQNQLLNNNANQIEEWDFKKNFDLIDQRILQNNSKSQIDQEIGQYIHRSFNNEKCLRDRKKISLVNLNTLVQSESVKLRHNSRVNFYQNQSNLRVINNESEIELPEIDIEDFQITKKDAKKSPINCTRISRFYKDPIDNFQNMKNTFELIVEIIQAQICVRCRESTTIQYSTAPKNKENIYTK
eukprot:403342955